MQYYIVLRKVFQREPPLRKQVARCKECGIFFLSDISNCGRRDLRCPFGCRDAHRKESSARRSAAYNSTETGKDKKREQNAQRNRQSKTTIPAGSPPAESLRAEIIKPVISHTITKVQMFYIQDLLNEIEHRFVPQNELQRVLIKKWSQHSIDNNQKAVIISKIGEIIILRE